MKRKEEKKTKGKKSKKSKKFKKSELKKPAPRREKKVKESVKALRKEIRRLNRELQEKGDLIRALSGRQETAEPSAPVDEGITSLQSDWPDNGSITDRKKTWERHQYLCARYEHHLETGCDKRQARAGADRDLRVRYGEDAGYTAEQLEAILS